MREKTSLPLCARAETYGNDSQAWLETQVCTVSVFGQGCSIALLLDLKIADWYKALPFSALFVGVISNGPKLSINPVFLRISLREHRATPFKEPTQAHPPRKSPNTHRNGLALVPSK